MTRGSTCKFHNARVLFTLIRFFNVTFQAPTRGQLFLQLTRETAPFSRFLRHATDANDLLSS